MSYNLILFGVSGFWISSEIFLMIVKRSHAREAERRDEKSLPVLWIACALGPFLGGMLTSFQAARMPSELQLPAFWTGIAMIFAGLFIRWAAILTLKKYFTVDVAIAKDHKVIDHGLYRLVRHPSYTGSLLSFFGLGLAMVNWASFAAIVLITWGAFVYRIIVEERVLNEALGEAYRSYSARTKRLIPGVF